MRIRSVVSQASVLSRVSAEASRLHGGGRLAAAARARRLRTRGSFQYDEALAAGLLDPALDERDALRFVSEHDTSRVVERLNPQSLAHLTAEKAIFYRHFGALGIRIPALYGLIGRGASWSATAGARPLGGVDGAASLLAEGTPAEFVVKPSAGHHGLGVRVLRHEAGELIDLDGTRRTPLQLVRELQADPEFDLFVVQERLRNHAEVLALCESETLQTVRLTTFVPDSGGPQVVHASFKLAFGGSNVDNFHSGANGNVIAEVDLATGQLLRPFALTGPPHPGIEGRPLPEWHGAVALARRGAELLLPQRTMGFDVALTPSGPVIVEANRGYDPFPSAHFGAVLRAIKRAAAGGGPALVLAGA